MTTAVEARSTVEYVAESVRRDDGDDTPAQHSTAQRRRLHVYCTVSRIWCRAVSRLRR